MDRVEPSAVDLGRFDGFRLNPRKAFAGSVRGERTAVRKGISIDFADFRNYSEGDDLRHLDWNVLARLETPVIRTYQDEEDLTLHLLVDGTESMAFDEPSKLEAASAIARLLGRIALAGGDSVRPQLLGRASPPITFRGRAGFARLASWLGALRPAPGSLNEALAAFSRSQLRRGVALIVSDGLDPQIASSVRLLAGRGHEVWFIQVLSEVEIDPDLEGDLRLLDSETGDSVELTANRQALEEYRRRLATHNRELADAVTRVGGRFARTTSRTKTEVFARDVLKREGWVK